MGAVRRDDRGRLGRVPVVKEAPPPPWQCWSTKPGTRVSPRWRSAGAGGVPPPAPVIPLAAGPHPAGLDEPGWEDDAVGAEDHVAQPFVAGSGVDDEGLLALLLAAGVRRFHLRMTNRNRK